MDRVTVALPGRAYDILIGAGLLREAALAIAALAPRVAVVTDETVAALHLPALAAELEAAGVAHSAVVVPPGEASKSFAQLERVSEALLATRIERGDAVVALGGGVVGDLAGFAAAVLRRGVRLVQLPTTLLAQVDSSVGGKTGINAAAGKNLIGAFHQPVLVIADTALLATLPPREWRAGYAEVVKYGLLGDAGFFAWLEEGGGVAMLAGEPAALAYGIATSCRAKAAIVARDETETGDRALLNLGHTFGHALEAEAGYDGRLLHGEAIAVGMAMAFRFSADLGLCSLRDAARVTSHFAGAGLPTRIGEIDWGAGGTPDTAALIGRMRQDKKVARGALTFILVRKVGGAFIARDVAETDLAEFLAAEV